ncbi:MAG: GAF domain-containing protein [Bryobacteraceae bacterium]|nr:GAF domain-containing protein [Bryobacteraceae bacterium]
MPAINRRKIRFRERAELLDFLLEAAAATAETLDLDQLLANVAEIVQRVLPSELFAILLYSERARGLRIRHSIGHRHELSRSLVIPVGEGITGVAAATMQPVMVGDVLNDPRYIASVDAVRSELAVPMTARGKLVGVIDVQSTLVNAYTPYDRSVLQLVASRVASAIENAKLYRRVERQNRLLKTLATVSQEISSILALEELLHKIADVVRQLISYDAFLIMLVDQRNGVLRNQFSLRYDQRVDIDNVPLGSGITGAAVEAREPVKVNDTATDARYIASHPGILSEVAVPLILQNRVIGVLDVESERIGFFTDDHVRMLSLLAPHIANALENARLYQELAEREHRMDQDLKAARRLQRVLQPRNAPPVEGLDVALAARAAREISGDVYDFFQREDGRMLMVFGDSSGKGAAAALYGALVSGLLRSVGSDNNHPAQLMCELNESLLERKVEAKYATLLLALWDPRTRTFTFSNAGSSPPLVSRGDQLLNVHVEGVPIGLLANQTYDETVFQAEPGDVVVFYSDGVLDQQGPAAGVETPEYGEKRLGRTVRAARNKPARQIAGAIIDDLDTFSSGAAITDDQSLIVMKVL